MPGVLLNLRLPTMRGSLRCVSCLAVVGLSLAVFSKAHAEPSKRHPVDASDLVRLGSAHPHARGLLEEGEGALVAGDARRAAELFGQAADEAPHSALAARRHCQALMDLGDRAQALIACRRAVQREGSPLDMRSLVRAILASADRPTFDEIYEVTMLTARAERAMPRQPWGYAAACDVARRLADAAMLEACKKNLLRIAPDHAETKRALTLTSLGPARSLLGMTAGWGLMALVSIGTLLDWTRRAWAARMQPPPRADG